MKILVMSVMKTADVSKIFLAIFKRTYNGLYIYYFFRLQQVPIKSNDQGCNFAFPHLKGVLKSPIKDGLNAL